MVRRTVEDYRTILEPREVVIDLPSEPMWIDGDPTRLAQVVGNLLHNAAKFTREDDGTVSVSLTRVPGHAVLEIADTGAGIDSGTLKTLFEPFAQADRSLDRTHGGLGLGLALVKGMVELHGGEVSASSTGPGRGARFSVRLPLEAERANESNAMPAARPAARPKRVLVIEDNKDAANSLQEALQLTGHDVVVAYDGHTGLLKAREYHPEIVICDIGLPEMDGYEVARAIRADAALKRSLADRPDRICRARGSAARPGGRLRPAHREASEHRGTRASARGRLPWRCDTVTVHRLSRIGSPRPGGR